MNSIVCHCGSLHIQLMVYLFWFSVRAIRGSQDVTIRVSDQGGGIPRRMTDTLFEYLYTTAPTPAITSSVDMPGKVVFDLKAHLDYCEDQARGGENSDFCFPAQTGQLRFTDWEASVVSLKKFQRLLDFSRTNGRENSNVHNFLLDLLNNPSMFFKILRTLFFKNLILEWCNWPKHNVPLWPIMVQPWPAIVCYGPLGSNKVQ